MTEQMPRNAVLINILNKQAAERTLVSLLFLSLGTTARKYQTDILPHMTIATMSKREI